MTKIAINTKTGTHFKLNKRQIEKYNQLSGRNVQFEYQIRRDCEFLIKLVEETKPENIKIISIPDC